MKKRRESKESNSLTRQKNNFARASERMEKPESGIRNPEPEPETEPEPEPESEPKNENLETFLS